MRKIIFNLSEQRKIDRRALSLRVFLCLAAALTIDGFSYRMLSRHIRKSEIEKAETRVAQQRLIDLSRKAEGYRRYVGGQKGRSSRKIVFANQLISQKTFSYTDRLGFLEKILPEGIQVQSLALTNETADRITFTITAPSFGQLMESYRRLSPFQLSVTGENEKEGTFRANLQIVYSHGKK